MPNWYINRAEIRHKDPAQLNRLLKAYARDGCGVGQEFLPPPPNGNERTWRICNWGNKWDFGDGQNGNPATAVPGGVRLDFDTAWDPPLGIYLELLRQGFEGDALYWEPGNALCGRIEGSVVQDFEIRSRTISEIRKHVDAELIKEFAMEEYYADEEDEEDDTDLSESSSEPWEAQFDLVSLVAEKAKSYMVAIALLQASKKGYGV